MHTMGVDSSFILIETNGICPIGLMLHLLLGRFQVSHMKELPYMVQTVSAIPGTKLPAIIPNTRQKLKIPANSLLPSVN